MAYPAIALRDFVIGLEAALDQIIAQDEMATIPGGTLHEVLRNAAKAHPESVVSAYLAYTLEHMEDDLRNYA